MRMSKTYPIGGYDDVLQTTTEQLRREVYGTSYLQTAAKSDLRLYGIRTCKRIKPIKPKITAKRIGYALFYAFVGILIYITIDLALTQEWPL